MFDVARSSERPRRAHATAATTLVTARRLAMTTAGSTRRASHTGPFRAGRSTASWAGRPSDLAFDQTTEPRCGVSLEGTDRERVPQNKQMNDPGSGAPRWGHGPGACRSGRHDGGVHRGGGVGRRELARHTEGVVLLGRRRIRPGGRAEPLERACRSNLTEV